MRYRVKLPIFAVILFITGVFAITLLDNKLVNKYSLNGTIWVVEGVLIDHSMYDYKMDTMRFVRRNKIIFVAESSDYEENLSYEHIKYSDIQMDSAFWIHSSNLKTYFGFLYKNKFVVVGWPVTIDGILYNNGELIFRKIN